MGLTSFFNRSTLNKMTFSFKQVVIFVVVLILAAILFLTFILRRNTPVPSPVPDKPSDTVSIQSEVSEAPITTTNEVHSPDGEMNLIMEKVTEGEVSKYSFFVSGIPTNDRKLFFEKTLLTGFVMQISPNAWSPDNKYLFLKQSGADSVSYFVFNASGEVFSDEEQYIDVAPLFATRNTGYILSDITGWDSETLLHVFTNGPSYWFEVPSKSIIQLASR